MWDAAETKRVEEEAKRKRQEEFDVRVAQEAAAEREAAEAERIAKERAALIESKRTAADEAIQAAIQQALEAMITPEESEAKVTAIEQGLEREIRRLEEVMGDVGEPEVADAEGMDVDPSPKLETKPVPTRTPRGKRKRADSVDADVKKTGWNKVCRICLLLCTYLMSSCEV
jgi:hypothetical protein